MERARAAAGFRWLMRIKGLKRCARPAIKPDLRFAFLLV